MTNYKEYHAKGNERRKLLLTGLLLSSTLAVLFYKSVVAVVLFSPFAWVYLKYRKKILMKKRKWEFNQQFKQGIMALSAALNAGYSIENSFHEATKDLALMYGEDADIMREFSQITKQICMNKTVEECLGELAERSGIEDVENFAEIFQTAKRTGGDIMKIIQQTGKNIGERIEIQREMETLIAQKKMEANIMSVVPLGIILYMWVASPGFLDRLYHNVFGCMLMTVVLIVYLLSYLLMKKIVDIQL